jgi:hypothetical protein
MLGLRMHVKYELHYHMFLTNAPTDNLILYTVTFENRVNFIVIASEIEVEKGVLKV